MNVASDIPRQVISDRVGGSQFDEGGSYKFARIKEAKDAVLAKEPDSKLLDFGIGEPDSMAERAVVDELYHQALKYENRVYADNGGVHFLQAASSFMHSFYGVQCDPSNEMLHSIGSKSALSQLPAALINPGDTVLMTTPGYPVFGTIAEYYGGQVYELPLLEENNFLPQFEEVPESIWPLVKVLVLNYPNNPTGAVATYEFFEKCVALAKKHSFVIIQDAAYSTIVFDGKPLSLLSVPGAKDVSVELHSMSKSFNMTGWRMGWVCGNKTLISAYSKVKSNCDSGQFLAIQNAAAYALSKPSITENVTQKYAKRMKAVTDILNSAGLNCKMSAGSFFLYVKAPTSVSNSSNYKKEFPSGEAFSQWLIRELKVCTVPWDDAGSYIRFSMTFEDLGIVNELQARLSNYTFSY